MSHEICTTNFNFAQRVCSDFMTEHMNLTHEETICCSDMLREWKFVFSVTIGDVVSLRLIFLSGDSTLDD